MKIFVNRKGKAVLRNEFVKVSITLKSVKESLHEAYSDVCKSALWLKGSLDEINGLDYSLEESSGYLDKLSEGEYRYNKDISIVFYYEKTMIMYLYVSVFSNIETLSSIKCKYILTDDQYDTLEKNAFIDAQNNAYKFAKIYAKTHIDIESMEVIHSKYTYPEYDGLSIFFTDSIDDNKVSYDVIVKYVLETE